MGSLMMERDLLADLFINLIDNAGKASRRGDIIELNAHGGIISVTDHGIGIAESELDKLTQPFYMVDKSARERQAARGLGLRFAMR